MEEEVYREAIEKEEGMAHQTSRKNVRGACRCAATVAPSRSHVMPSDDSEMFDESKINNRNTEMQLIT